MTVHRRGRVMPASAVRPEAGIASLAMLFVVLLSFVGSLTLASPTTSKSNSEGATAAPANENAATKPVTTGKDEAQRLVRQIFRPTTTKSAKTSWSELVPGPRKNDDKHLIMFIHACRGDRWPVKIRGKKEVLFQAELIDGDENQVEIRVLDGQKDQRVVVKLDQPEKVEVAGKEFLFSYGTTMVAGSEPQYVDDAFIILSLKQEK